jgi:hypothetical protein
MRYFKGIPKEGSYKYMLNIGTFLIYLVGRIMESKTRYPSSLTIDTLRSSRSSTSFTPH